jgi:tight adherence protein C
MPLLFVILIYLFLATALLAIGAASVSPASVVGARLRMLLGATSQVRRALPWGPRVERVLEPLGEALPKSPAEVSATRVWLMQAGYRESKHAAIYFGIRALAAIALLVLVILTGSITHYPLLLIVAPAIGYVLPRFILKKMIRIRQNQIQLALPDALDLAVICVEAGLGLEQALDRVGLELRHAHPALSSELALMTLEIRAGMPRIDALRNLATRTGVEDMRSFVAVLIQTDRFGTSVATSLRVHSDALRTERRQRAEELAAKTSIKIIIPLVLFIFPTLFIVVLGPVVITVVRDFLPQVGR